MRIPTLLLHRATKRFYVNWKRKRVYFGTDKEVAHQRHRAWLVEQGFSLQVAKIETIADLMVFGLRYSEEQYQPGKNGRWGERDHVTHTIKVATAHFDDMPIAQFGPLALLEFRAALLKQGSSVSCAQNHMRRLRRIVRWAISRQLMPATITAELLNEIPPLPAHVAPRRKKRRPPVEDAVLERTLPLLNPVVAAMVRLQRLTGARPQNICDITIDQIDRKTYAALGSWAYNPESHKTDSDRELAIMIGPRGQALLAPFMENREASAPLFSPEEVALWRSRARRDARKTPLTPSQLARRRKAEPLRAPGKRYTSMAYYNSIRGALKRFNRDEEAAAKDENRKPNLIPRWSPYQIRHARATEVRSTDGLEGAQVALGHSKADVTAVYTHRDLERAARIARESG